MAIYTVNIDLPATVLGDEWTGLSIGPVVVTGITQGNLTRITMGFVGPISPVPYTADSNGLGDALITITNAGTWEAIIAPVASFLPAAGEWKWDMKFYNTGNVTPITLYSGVITVYPTNLP